VWIGERHERIVEMLCVGVSVGIWVWVGICATINFTTNCC
jgi:hypothetical protein